MKPSWHKLLVSLLGIAIIVGIWQWAVWHLYSLPGESITAFTSITNNCFYGIVMLVFFFVTGKVLIDWKNTTSTVVNQVAQRIDEHRKEEIDQTLREFSTPKLTERYSDR